MASSDNTLHTIEKLPGMTADGTGDVIKQQAIDIWSDLTHPIATYHKLENSPQAQADQRLLPDLKIIENSKDSGAQRSTAEKDFLKTEGSDLLNSDPSYMLAKGIVSTLVAGYEQGKDSYEDVKAMLNPNATAAQEQQAQNEYKNDAGHLIETTALVGLSITPVGDTVDVLDAGVADASTSLIGDTADATRVISDGSIPVSDTTQAIVDGTRPAADTAPVAADPVRPVPATDAQSTAEVARIRQQEGLSQPSSLEAQKGSEAAKAGESGNGQVESSTAKPGSDATANDAAPPISAPQAQANTLNRLANGNLAEIKTTDDSGLMKTVLRTTANDDAGSTGAVVKQINTANQADLGRVAAAQRETDLDNVINQGTRGPLTAIRNDVNVDGQSGWALVQEDGGQSLGSFIKSSAAKEFGDGAADAATPEQVQQLIQAHPQLNQAVGDAMYQMMFKGNGDLMELSNLAVNGTQDGAAVSLDEPLETSIIDSKMNWTPSTEPTWGIASAMPDSMPRAVADLYAGKTLAEVSPALQEQAETTLKLFQSQAGRTQLEQAGLTDTEIDAATSRLQYLTTKGFPPAPDFGTPAGDTMLEQNGQMADHYNSASDSTSLQQVLDKQNAQLHPGSTS